MYRYVYCVSAVFISLQLVKKVFRPFVASDSSVVRHTKKLGRTLATDEGKVATV